MILPAQSLDRCDVTAAVCINPFGSIDFTEITGPYRLRGWKFVLDQSRCRLLTEPRKSSRNLFFTCIVSRYNFRRCFDTVGQVGGLSIQKTKLVIADDGISRPAPVVELNHLLPPSSCTLSSDYDTRYHPVGRQSILNED